MRDEMVLDVSPDRVERAAPGRYPDLICLGAQKAATTWLYEVFRPAPEIFLTPVKELHYFSQLYNHDARNYGPTHRAQQAKALEGFLEKSPEYFRARGISRESVRHIARADVDDRWYAEIFSGAPHHAACVEICPSYLNMPLAGVQHLLRLNPAVRLLALIRDPVDRCWSQIRMHVSRGSLDQDFTKLLDGRVSLAPFVFYTDYRAALTKWRAYARPEQLKLVLYDEIVADGGRVVADLYDFMGVTPGGGRDLRAKIVFKGDEIDMTADVRRKLLEVLSPQYEYLAPLFPTAVESWISRHNRHLNSR